MGSSALEPTEVAAVVGHERAHLEYAHHRYLMLAEAVEAGFARLGPVRCSAGVASRTRTLGRRGSGIEPASWP